MLYLHKGFRHHFTGDFYSSEYRRSGINSRDFELWRNNVFNLNKSNEALKACDKAIEINS